MTSPSSTAEQPVSQAATDWCALDWASMSQDQVKETLAAMEREHWARAPEHEARRAKEEATARARLLDAFRSHLRQCEQRNKATEATCRGRQVWQTDFGTLVLSDADMKL